MEKTGSAARQRSLKELQLTVKQEQPLLGAGDLGEMLLWDRFGERYSDMKRGSWKSLKGRGSERDT